MSRDRGQRIDHVFRCGSPGGSLSAGHTLDGGAFFWRGRDGMRGADWSSWGRPGFSTCCTGRLCLCREDGGRAQSPQSEAHEAPVGHPGGHGRQGHLLKCLGSLAWGAGLAQAGAAGPEAWRRLCRAW